MLFSLSSIPTKFTKIMKSVLMGLKEMCTRVKSTRSSNEIRTNGK